MSNKAKAQNGNAEPTSAVDIAAAIAAAKPALIPETTVLKVKAQEADRLAAQYLKQHKKALDNAKKHRAEADRLESSADEIARRTALENAKAAAAAEVEAAFIRQAEEAKTKADPKRAEPART